MKRFLDFVQRHTHRRWVVRLIAVVFGVWFLVTWLFLAARHYNRNVSNFRAEVCRCFAWLRTGRLV